MAQRIEGAVALVSVEAQVALRHPDELTGGVGAKAGTDQVPLAWARALRPPLARRVRSLPI